MEKRKPNTLLTVALVLMLLAALVCLIVFLSTRGNKKNNTASVSADTTQVSTPPIESTDPTEVPVPSETPAAPSYDAAKLQADLDDCIDGVDSSWQVVAIDLEDGKKFESSVNCKQTDTMVAADLTKLFLMAAAYDRVNAGALKEGQMSGLVTRMIRDDSADAANELTKLLGGGDGEAGRKVVNEYALSIGCAHTEFNRLFGESGTQNYTTAGDCATLLQLIAEGNCVSADASGKMLEVLTGTEGERIPGGVPAGTTVAHLNANITGTCCADAGIVFTETRNFVLAIVCNQPYTNEGSTKKCVQLTEIVYDALSK